MNRKQFARTTATFSVAMAIVLSAVVGPAWADDPAALSQAPAPGDPTTMMVPFSVPVSFSAAVDEADEYEGVVLAIRYDNPEVTGEYSFGSGITPEAFEAEFMAQYGTTPAATNLVVATTVPEDDPLAKPQAPPTIEMASAPFVPLPANFSEETEALFTPPTIDAIEAESASPLSAGVTDWRASQVDVEINDYTPNRVTLVSSYWWIGEARPTKVPNGFGVEFEVNMYNATGTDGVQPLCNIGPGLGNYDANYRKRFAAQTQNWNWRVVRPDGVTAPSSLGAYADYNSLGDACQRGSFGIGLRYPQGIQYVNGAYGIIFVIDAPKGFVATSTLSANTQAVSDSFCTSHLGQMMSLTDCMGVYAGSWPGGSGPMSQNVLSESRNWTAPNRCWMTDYSNSVLGEVYDNTSWQCPNF